MGLEVATYISDLDTSNPASGDQRSQGDDHLRLIKAALKTTFPGASKPFAFPTAAAKTTNFTVLGTEQSKIFYVDTTAGVTTATLPTLVSGDAGWECSFLKTNTGTNPLLIAPASGTLQSGEVSGLSAARRCIPGHVTTAVWTGVAWFISRVPGAPVGSCLEFHGTTLPVGYEWPTGQTLASASTNYPEYNSVIGSGVTLDRQERVAAMADITGVSRLTDLTAGVGGTFGDTGGAESNTLTSAQSGQKAISAAPVTINDPTHVHDTFVQTLLDGGPFPIDVRGTGINSASALTGITAAFTLAGSDAVSAHNNVQPTIICNFILVVE